MIMENILKHYKVRISALAPIHIGCGSEISKKEYVYLHDKQKAVIVDIRRLYAKLQSSGLNKSFDDYYLKGKDDLGTWLRKNGFAEKQIMDLGSYVLDTADVYDLEKYSKGYKNLQNITAFIKDGYGKPYVPGSSIKGMLRTALLYLEIQRNGQKKKEMAQNVESSLIPERRVSRNRYMSYETSKIEVLAFNTLDRDKNKIANAVNCNLSELIIGDSRPLEITDLTLCQKIDLSKDGKEHSLPLYREALRPGTEIEFDLTIGDKLPYSIEDILCAVNELNRVVNDHFYSVFGRGNKEKNIVWLGGGVGFSTKTILSALYGDYTVLKADIVFKNTLNRNYEIHKHNKDRAVGIAPHVCKCTIYKNKLYDMGMGKIDLIG